MPLVRASATSAAEARNASMPGRSGLPHHPSLGPKAQRPIILAAAIAALLLFAFLLAYMMHQTSLDIVVAAGLSVALAFLCFVRMKWVLYALIFACLFSPELQIGEVLGRAAKRPITIRVEDILLVVITIMWLARAAVRKELGLMLRTPLNRPIVAYALACVLATGIGISYGWVTERTAAVLFVLKYIQYFVLFFMIVNHIETRRDMLNLVIAGVATYLAVCVYCFFQLLDPEVGRPSLFAEHLREPNTLAGYLLFMMGICSGLMLSVRWPQNRVVFGVLFVSGFILLAFTLSRSGWAGMFGLLAVLVFVGRQRYAVLGVLAAVIAGLVLISFEIEWLPQPIKERVDETRGIYEPWPGMKPPVVVFGAELDPSASERYRSYEASLTSWAERSREHWLPALTGSGVLGSKTFIDGQYVRVLVETGLFGLVTFAALLAAIWRHVWRSYKMVHTPWYKGLALGYLAGFAGLIVHALAANTFIIVRIMEPFFIFTGIVVLLPAMERAGEAAEPAPAPTGQT